MTPFTGYEYLLIDVANLYGLDKLLFEERIAWTLEHRDELASLMNQAKNPIGYIKAVYALRDAENHVPTGHLMGLDACASGLQIMGAVMGCLATATNTGLVDPTTRADIYTTVTNTMNQLLHKQGINVDTPRDDVKYSTMT